MAQEKLNTRQAAEYIGVAKRTLDKWRLNQYQGRGPKYIRLGYKTIRYTKTELDKWLKKRERT